MHMSLGDILSYTLLIDSLRSSKYLFPLCAEHAQIDLFSSLAHNFPAINQVIVQETMVISWDPQEFLTRRLVFFLGELMELEVKEVVLSESDNMSLCLKVAIMCQELSAGPQ